ncbi:MAG: cation-translocating P-type ATPase [Myxococcales bacterium]
MPTWTGLSSEEAARRLARDGANELPSEKRRGLLRLFWGVLREPMFLMLVAAGALYFAMGEPVDALMLVGFVTVVIAITVYEERRTERALEALRELSSPRALVVRGGERRRIPGREVVVGDVLVLSEGDRVPADALLVEGRSLSVDESLLTGESAPVRKRPDGRAASLDRPGGDDLASVFSGTLVTAGQGVAVVVATGARTELGKIGKSLQALKEEPTPLQKETRRLVLMFGVVGMTSCVLVVVLYALTRGGTLADWNQGLLAGIALAMSVLPEEFPVVLTVFLALGAWRISKSHVLTRRVPAIEALGAATVLCVDKTGTLTCNQMTLKVLHAGREEADSASEAAGSPALSELLAAAVLASRPQPFEPMDRALHAAGGAAPPGWELVHEYPLSPELLAVSQAWRTGAGGPLRVASKGAPEAIAALCGLAPEARAKFLEAAGELAGRGLRILGVARGEVDEEALPARHANLHLALLGLVGFEDPLRATVPPAVAECRSAGIRVVMITGDYPATARSIARQAGLANPDAVISGRELDAMGEQALARRVLEVDVFARVVPEQKLRLVQALQAGEQVVAMTGDGVNDAPALKAAHIGIAMGGRGTDVAREAAGLVLLDDDFASIVAAVRLGRRIFDNIQKAIRFVFAVHVPIAGLSLLPVLMPGWPLLLLPAHIAFLELVIGPSCALVFEGEEPESNVMARPPRDPRQRLFSPRFIGVAVFEGLCALAACVAVLLLARQGHAPDAARALTFATLVVSFLTIIVVNLSSTRGVLERLRAPNPALWYVLGGASVLLVAVLVVPPLQRLFHFAAVHPVDLALGVAAGLASVAWFELLKLPARRRARAASVSARASSSPGQ